MLVFYYCIGKKQHILASLRKAEQNIFVPSGLATGVFEELPQVNAMRRTIETADRHATKFFDETIIYDTQPRIKKSKMDNVPNVEEPTIIKVPDTAQ